ncbi:MAG: ribokinase [Kiritimatiellia bacterium]
MKPGVRILNYGSLNLDLVYAVPHIARPGETISSASRRVHAGGKGANQSVAAARAGGKIYHAGKVGRDGEWLVEKLSKAGVDARFVSTAKENTGHAVIQVDFKGENAIFIFPGANQLMTRAGIDGVLDNFSAGDYLMLQNEINEISYLMHSARERRMKVCFNPAPMDGRVARYPLRKASFLILNETEGAALAGRSGPEAILRRLSQQYPETEIVLTMGKQGAVAVGPGAPAIRAPAFRVRAVDTTAAGDTFIGYYVAGRASGMDLGPCLRQACAAAALCVTRPGAMDSIPSMAAVRRFTGALK